MSRILLDTSAYAAFLRDHPDFGRIPQVLVTKLTPPAGNA
jgi:hypothetical protein